MVFLHTHNTEDFRFCELDSERFFGNPTGLRECLKFCIDHSLVKQNIYDKSKGKIVKYEIKMRANLFAEWLRDLQK